MILCFDYKRYMTDNYSNGTEDRALVNKDGSCLLKGVLATVIVRPVILDMIPNTIKYGNRLKIF